MNEQPTRWVAETSASQQRDQQTSCSPTFLPDRRGIFRHFAFIERRLALWHTLPALTGWGFTCAGGTS